MADVSETGPKVPVLFLNSPESFGADTFIQALLMRHLEPRFEVHAACPADTPSWAALSKIPNVQLRPTSFGPSLTSNTSRLARAVGLLPALVDLLALARYVREHRIQILHASDRPRDAVTCAALARLTGARAVIHLHVKYDDWIGAPVRWALRRADALIGVSAFVSRSLVAKGYRAERVHTVLNAIDPADWDFRCDPAPVRAELGLPARAKVILCVARLFHWKGQRELLQAAALVRRELPDLQLLIVGAEDAVAGGPRYLEELRALVGKLDLSAHVRFLGKRDDVARLMAAADLFCLPSFEEPFGLVYAEAMAMKRPVVGLDNGGTPEVVEQGETGLLVRPGEPGEIEELAASLARLLRDPALRTRFGEAGRHRVEQLFSPRQLATAMAAVYDQLPR